MYEIYKYKIRKIISILFFRKFIINKMRKEIINDEFTIIANNCIGGLIYKDLGKKFLTPTIGLFIKNNDFVKFVNNLDYYINYEELKEITMENVEYPCGKIDDIIIHFMHYNSFKEAKEKWEERKKRINYDNIFIFMSRDDTFDERISKKFHQIKYNNKVLYTQDKNVNFNYEKYIPGFRDGYLEDITRYHNIFGTKLYEYNLDIVKFLNTGDLGR